MVIFGSERYKNGYGKYPDLNLQLRIWY
jgi:hypothetical protein